MLKALKSKKAEGYIDVAISVLIVVAVLVLVLSIWSIVTLKQDVSYMCEELLEIATVTGRIGSEVQLRYEELCSELGFEPRLEFDAVYFDESTKKVQLGEVITCTITHNMILPGFGGFEFPFDVTESRSGLSRVYWKKGD